MRCALWAVIKERLQRQPLLGGDKRCGVSTVNSVLSLSIIVSGIRPADILHAKLRRRLWIQPGV